jgi:hypothetical protein
MSKIESLKTEKARLENTVATAWMKVIEADEADDAYY